MTSQLQILDGVLRFACKLLMILFVGGTKKVSRKALNSKGQDRESGIYSLSAAKKAPRFLVKEVTRHLCSVYHSLPSL